ncbi:voltage-gated potassium channel protein [Nocardia sp. MH4]|uniref:potassium channel family protein n=1 Tax=unclassified Nocardia TaxID=2637762 RepID=UPI001C4F38A3|nr:potassium channel family protein [Nocardia sp. MH4]MBW0270829.1 voltage-gated potassium channel protein [Nocardia sp. MH4]
MTRGLRVGVPGHALRNGAAAVCALLLYYSVPLSGPFELDAWPGEVFGIVSFIAGVIGLAWLVWRRIQHFLNAPDSAGGRVDGVLLVVCIVCVVFSLFYYRLQQRQPDQFDGLVTRTDALYYTMSTLGTVGYGDVHAVGQVARIAAMVQIAFDLVVIGTLATIVTSSVTRRLAAFRPPPPAVTEVSDDGPDTTR